MVIRVFSSAVDPADVDDVRRLFSEDVKPVFAAVAGCGGIELMVSTEPNAGGLVEGAAVSRWESKEAMDGALASRQVSEALVRVLQLLRHEPVTRVFEVIA